MKTVTFFLVAVLVESTFASTSSEQEKEIMDAFLPKRWTSIRECPVRYYHLGLVGIAKPVGGVPTNKGEFAHMAAIGWTQSGGEILWNCGGTLISPSFVLTAGHCGYFEDAQPDVIRLGDIDDLNSAEDDKDVQQFKVAEFIFHPNYSSVIRYNDIALIRLDGEAKIESAAVVPACLWIDDEIHYSYNRFEAAGWGQTTFGGDTTPKLLKVKLDLVSNEECRHSYDTNRRLKQGIVGHQMCAGDKQQVMDTCLGDSGGPLETKLFGNGFIIPFVIGVTSFGRGCGTSSPGVYTRISHFIPWIQNATKIDFDPPKCAARNIYLREIDPDLVKSRNEEYTQIDFTLIEITPPSAFRNYIRADIGWRKGSDYDWDCAGAIVEERFILTSAKCVLLRESGNPSAIRLPSTRQIQGKIMEIDQIFLHPDHQAFANDLALVKLKEEIEFGKDVKPTCIWYDQNKRDPPEETDTFGWGPSSFYFEKPDDDSITKLKVIGKYYDQENCSQKYEPDKFWSRKITENHICYGFEKHYVPGLCKLFLGEPTLMWFSWYSRQFQQSIGLTTYSRECGSGTPNIQTRLLSYVDWIDSIIFGTRISQSVASGLQFHDDNKFEGDNCLLPSGDEGSCKHDVECPEIATQFRLSEIICSFDGYRAMICCPKPRIVRREVEEYFKGYLRKYEEFRNPFNNSHDPDYSLRPFQEYSHVVRLVENEQNTTFHCFAALIHDQFLLASSACIKSFPAPKAALLGDLSVSGGPTHQIIKVSEIIPKGTDDTKYDDLTLIKLEKPATISSTVVPALLWLEEDRVPFLPFAVDWVNPGKDEKTDYLKGMISISNEECGKAYANDEILAEGIKDGQICARVDLDYERTCFLHTGSLLRTVLLNTNLQIPYLIGITSHVDDKECKEGHPIVFSRVSHYANWIFDTIMSKK